MKYYLFVCIFFASVASTSAQTSGSIIFSAERMSRRTFATDSSNGTLTTYSGNVSLTVSDLRVYDADTVSINSLDPAIIVTGDFKFVFPGLVHFIQDSTVSNRTFSFSVVNNNLYIRGLTRLRH